MMRTNTAGQLAEAPKAPVTVTWNHKVSPPTYIFSHDFQPKYEDFLHKKSATPLVLLKFSES